ncbi:Josephin domain-containing protein [Mycena sanguinolenta]|uniref:ubiquitinyl hydrolase 1 n=1 Tax=Mycena sanguinolenta TaxID=230812 RepID=A0A8H7DI08_9AGAR|nr:Josephin domain-containing protein [Mycena sanguinolenta]
MAGLENLPIYHERQEEGSMLCAQHALNSLLQGSYFSAPDLSEIARNLDSLEESYDDANHGTRSGNMDDTGFFSVQVLDSALKVFGLNLSRWRGEEMRPFHDHPETQLAFVLNYEQHWFTLRRFGPHWFNLNSFTKPEWISKLYLGMVLQQAEADGYSVFAVTPADPSSSATLPHTEADELANTIPEPHSTSRPNLHSFSSHGSGSNQPEFVEGVEDEDYELQAALQASLMGDASPSVPPPVIRHNVPLPSGSDSPSSESASQDDLDPVAATMERSRLGLERMRAEQEHAQRQLWADEGNQGTRERDSEEEMIRRAIEEASARLEGHGTETDSDMHGVVPPQSSYYNQERVYDDDDAELQAALKASLEQLPEGWTPPEQVPHEEPIRPSVSVSQSSAEPVDAPSPPAPAEEEGQKYDLSPLKDETTVTRTQPMPPTEEIQTVRISLCSDLTSQKDLPDADQCPPGTRICLTKTNHKDGESDRVTGVVPLAQTSALNPSYMPLSSPKGISILLHGASYPHPINVTDVPQSVNISVLCTPGAESQPTITSYNGELLELAWSSEAGCGFAAGDDEKHDENPGNGGSSRSLSSVGWFLLLLLVAFAVYMGLGAYYNYSTYGASGTDLIPHRDFWAEVPWMLRDVVSHLCSSVRPRRSSSHRGGYIAV